MHTITRDDARTLMQNRSDLTVVETLSEENYNEFHLPGAKNVPLNEDFKTAIQQAVPQKSKPVLVYCYDEVCEASRKAAEQMENLGYQDVYDYEAGKMDWKEAGFPVES